MQNFTNTCFITTMMLLSCEIIFARYIADHTAQRHSRSTHHDDERNFVRDLTMATQRKRKLHLTTHCNGNFNHQQHLVNICPKGGCGVNHCIGIMLDSDVLLTSAHCLYGSPSDHGIANKHSSCRDNSFQVIDHQQESHEISYTLSHAGYTQHVRSDIQSLYRNDIALVFLKTKVFLDESINCLEQTECDQPEETCWIHKINPSSGTHHRHQVAVTSIGNIDFNGNGCTSGDTFIVTRIAGHKTDFIKGDSGSPIVCERTVAGTKHFYIRGLLSQKFHNQPFATMTSLNAFRGIRYGCVLPQAKRYSNGKQ